MKLVFAVSGLVLAVIALPFAWDWRSPFPMAVRSWALMALIALSLGVIVAEAWALRTSEPGQRALKVFSALGLLAAILVLTSTLTQEARFRWARYYVLQTKPATLEKLGRHVIVGYRNLTEVRKLVKLKAIGGVFLSAHNVRGKSIAQIREETASFQQMKSEQGLPQLWIATDQEGGVVSRLSPPLERLPPLSEIVGHYSDPIQRKGAVWRYGETQGGSLAKVGVNLNFAPVVDVNYRIVNPDDRYTRIYKRAISSDPVVVAQAAGWYCAALEETGVRCTLKHFPGLGRVFDDTHNGQASLVTSVDELTETDWVPFRKLMTESNAFTMLSHARLRAIDSDHPVSVSTAVVAGMIRGDWEYDGVLITDNFTMRAIYYSNLGIEGASIQALNAGVDLILISWDTDQYYRVMYALLKADEQGTLDSKALQRSDRRLARAGRRQARFQSR
jgi:beta-N-acetylhexosaminidase